jgi:hypothetical protein
MDLVDRDMQVGAVGVAMHDRDPLVLAVPEYGADLLFDPADRFRRRLLTGPEGNEKVIGLVRTYSLNPNISL